MVLDFLERIAMRSSAAVMLKSGVMRISFFIVYRRFLRIALITLTVMEFPAILYCCVSEQGLMNESGNP